MVVAFHELRGAATSQPWTPRRSSSLASKSPGPARVDRVDPGRPRSATAATRCRAQIARPRHVSSIRTRLIGFSRTPPTRAKTARVRPFRKAAGVRRTVVTSNSVPIGPGATSRATQRVPLLWPRSGAKARCPLDDDSECPSISRVPGPPVLRRVKSSSVSRLPGRL